MLVNEYNHYIFMHKVMYTYTYYSYMYRYIHKYLSYPVFLEHVLQLVHRKRYVTSVIITSVGGGGCCIRWCIIITSSTSITLIISISVIITSVVSIIGARFFGRIVCEVIICLVISRINRVVRRFLTVRSIRVRGRVGIMRPFLSSTIHSTTTTSGTGIILWWRGIGRGGVEKWRDRWYIFQLLISSVYNSKYWTRIAFFVLILWWLDNIKMCKYMYGRCYTCKQHYIL